MKTTDDVVFPFPDASGWRVAVAGNVLTDSHTSRAEAAAAGRIVARRRLARALVVMVGGRVIVDGAAGAYAFTMSVPLVPRVSW